MLPNLLNICHHRTYHSDLSLLGRICPLQAPGVWGPGWCLPQGWPGARGHPHGLAERMNDPRAAQGCRFRCAGLWLPLVPTS